MVTTTTLYIVDPDNYFDVVTGIFKKKLTKKKVIYVTSNKTYSAITETFKKKNMGVGNVFFIDCISKQVDKNSAVELDNCMFLDGPRNITEIAISLSKAMSSVQGEKTLFLDSISTMLIYNDEAMVGRFSSFLVNKMREHEIDACIMALSSDTDRAVIKTMRSFVDKVEGIGAKK